MDGGAASGASQPLGGTLMGKVVGGALVALWRCVTGEWEARRGCGVEAHCGVEADVADAWLGACVRLCVSGGVGAADRGAGTVDGGSRTDGAGVGWKSC